jgi:hypothetical protein
VTASFEIYLIAGIYLVWVFGKGILASRQIHHLEDYLLGGRSLSSGLLAATLAATLLGGGASLGIFGRAYSEGPFFLFATLGWYLAIILTGLWLAAPIRHSGKATVGEFVTTRYGPALGRVTTGLSLVYSMGLLAAQLAALREVGRILLPGVSPEWILAAGTFVVLLYNWAGGFWAVVKTDQIQFFVLAGGFAGLAVLAGQQGWTATIPPGFFPGGIPGPRLFHAVCGGPEFLAGGARNRPSRSRLGLFLFPHIFLASRLCARSSARPRGWAGPSFPGGFPGKCMAKRGDAGRPPGRSDVLGRFHP